MTIRTFDYCRGSFNDEMSGYIRTRKEFGEWVRQKLTQHNVESSVIEHYVKLAEEDGAGYYNIDTHTLAWGCEYTDHEVSDEQSIQPETPIEESGIVQSDLPTDSPSFGMLDRRPPQQITDDTPAEIEQVEYPTLEDPELQLAQEWYIELNCPDMNIDVCKGIDDCQRDIKKIHELIKDNILERLVLIERSIATLLSEISTHLQVLVTQVEHSIKNIYETIVFNNDTKLTFIEDQIKKLVELNGISYEGELHKEKETSNTECVTIVNVDTGHGIDGIHESNDGEVEKEHSPILQSCCEFPQPWIIKFDDGQLAMIIEAIKSISINPVTNKTTIEHVDTNVCQEDFPAEGSYDLSECYQKDLNEYRIRHDVDKLIKQQSKDIEFDFNSRE